MIKMIWELISKEVERFENEFDQEHPEGFNLRKARKQAEQEIK